MRKYICLVLWAAILGGIGSLLLFGQSYADDPDTKPGSQIFLPFVTANGSVTKANAPAAQNIQITQGGQGGRIDAFSFYIPFPTDILDDQFEIGLSDTPTNNRPPPLFDVDIETIISIAVHREGSVIYYDHWEDGLEPNLTLPVQASTEIWGDNNPANGIPPGFATDLLATAATPQDDVIILRNVVVLPRDPQALFYDGGDVLTSAGGAIAVSLTFWTAPPGPGILYTDAWELYPTNRWGTDYLIPIGENLAGTGPNQRLGFEVVGLNVQAVSDNTLVNIDLNADGTFETNVTLNQGGQFTTLGTEAGLGPASVLVGARVQASEPVQVHLFTANPASRYEARGFTVVAENQWTDDYLAPRSSDGDFWLHNPDNAPLQVRVETSISAPTILTIPARSTIKYPPVGLSTATGVRFTSTDGRFFYGVVTLDQADAQDWGHSLLPFNRLATQTLIGLGLGNNNNPPNGDQSRIYVTASQATTIFVDYNNDGAVDASFPVAPLAEVVITDPDHNMAGAFLFTTDGTPFISVWGQDENADPALPSIDAGTGIVPLPSLLLQKSFSVAEDVDCTGSITVGDTLQFKLQYFNETANAINNVFVADMLPGTVTYLPNTTRINGTPVPDNGTSPFPLDEGGYNVGQVGPFSTGSIIFDVRIDDGINPIINRAEVSSEDLPLGTDSVVVFTSAQSGSPLYQIDNTVTIPPDGVAASGQVVTFSLAITNTGTETINAFPLRNLYETQYLTYQRAVSPPDTTVPGQLNWNDLTNNFGDLVPGATAGLTVTFVVNNLPGISAETIVRAIGAGGTLANGDTLPTCSGLATLSIRPPSTPTPPPTQTPTATFTPGPTSTPTPTSPFRRPTQTPLPPTPAGTPVSINVSPTVFPIAFLPETGSKEVSPTWWGWKSGLLLLVLGGFGAVGYYLKSKARR